MNLKNITVLLATCLIIACQKTEDQTSKQSLSYDLTQNGCATGAHNFSARDAYCNALKNDSLNNYCANMLRYELFKTECPGQTWQ
jgi:hypothetical protein